ncbi:hypothetical protein RYX36_007853 [Vicia faba]
MPLSSLSAILHFVTFFFTVTFQSSLISLIHNLRFSNTTATKFSSPSPRQHHHETTTTKCSQPHHLTDPSHLRLTLLKHMAAVSTQSRISLRHSISIDAYQIHSSSENHPRQRSILLQKCYDFTLNLLNALTTVSSTPFSL